MSDTFNCKTDLQLLTHLEHRLGRILNHVQLHDFLTETAEQNRLTAAKKTHWLHTFATLWA